MSVIRWLFILVGVIAILVAVGIALGAVWLNTFIHSDAFRHQVESRAGETMGGPVQIQGIAFDWLSGVKINGVVAQIDSSHINGRGALTANVESVDCRYALGDLLQRRLKLTGVTLVKPQVVLTRQPAAVPAAPATPDAAATGGDAGPGPAEPFQFVLESAKIVDGSFSIRDAAGASLTELTGVDGSADTSGYYEGKNIVGRLKIADIAFAPSIHVTDVSTEWIFDPHGNFITAKPFAATAFGGRLAGDYVLDATGPSLLDVNAKGLDVRQIGETSHPSSSVRLSGSLDGQSKWRSVESGRLNGEGDLQLSRGRLEGVRVLQDLAGVLRLSELNAPRLNSVRTHFEVANGQTRFTGLQVEADGFQMTGDGVIGSGGALNANMVLILSRDSMSRLPREAAAFFVAQPDGSGTIAYRLGGTIDNPRTDLGTRILMQGAAVKNAISNALNRFFHKHDKPAAGPPPEPEEAAPANPAPAPIPADQVPAPAPGPSGQ